MKITQIETIPVRVPLKKGMTAKTAHGVHATSDYVIIRIETDEGLVGLGEATVAPRWSGETSSGCARVIDELLAPVLIGQDPQQMIRLRAVMDREIKLNPFTKAGIEIALWDIAGKAAGMPVCQLLGGAVRDEVPIKMIVGALDPPAAVALAEQFLEWGVRCLKVKVGLDPQTDVQRVRAVRKVAGPEIPIGIDANCGWNLATARRTLQMLEMENLLFAEQPIPPADPAALADLRRTTPVPIMADESVFTLTDAWNVTTARAADILSVYPGKHGGLWPTVEIAHVARAAGIVCSIGSNLELGVGTAAMLHAAAALPVIDCDTYPTDIVGPVYHETDLLREPLSVGPQVARVPTGPGLGVELDEEQLQRWRV